MLGPRSAMSVPCNAGVVATCQTSVQQQYSTGPDADYYLVCIIITISAKPHPGSLMAQTCEPQKLNRQSQQLGTLNPKSETLRPKV